MPIELFYGNTFVLFLVFVLSIFSIDKLSEKQKISIIYLCSYGAAYMRTIPVKELLLIMTIVLFLMQEYFSFDRKKMKILNKIHYKLVDFIYMSVFQYKIWLVYFAILAKTPYLKKVFGLNDALMDTISVGIIILAFVWMYSLAEEFYSFTKMYDVVWKTPYYGVEFDEALHHRLEIITYFEDNLFWERKRAYSWFSIEFIVVWVRNRKRNRQREQIQQQHFFDGIMNSIKRITRVTKRFFNWLGRVLSRGHSTIPMQLIRILGYKHGLVFENTKCNFKLYKIIKRKIFEILYSRMFFEGLKDYLIIELCNDLKHYREYLVYLYPQIVQSKIEGKVYAPARKAFATNEKVDSIPRMNEWDIGKVIQMGFGFNGRSITEKRMQEKRELLKKYKGTS